MGLKSFGSSREVSLKKAEQLCREIKGCVFFAVRNDKKGFRAWTHGCSFYKSNSRFAGTIYQLNECKEKVDDGSERVGTNQACRGRSAERLYYSENDPYKKTLTIAQAEDECRKKPGCAYFELKSDGKGFQAKTVGCVLTNEQYSRKYYEGRSVYRLKNVRCKV